MNTDLLDHELRDLLARLATTREAPHAGDPLAAVRTRVRRRRVIRQFALATAVVTGLVVATVAALTLHTTHTHRRLVVTGPTTSVTSAPQAWADVVAPHLPAGATLVPLPPPASTVLGPNTSTTLLVYKLPSGRYLEAERDKAGPLDPRRAQVLLDKGDTDSTTAAGSRRYVITHNAAVWTQVIIQRPNGTNFMLSIESAPGVTYAQPPEFDVKGLVALSDALDNKGSDLP
jgi:hypothetical protein